jgi:copper(I)-binding protein
VSSSFRILNEEAFAVFRASSGKTAAGRLLLGAGVLALMIPAVAGCEAGAGAPTLEFHSASSGAHTVFNGIQITNAFVLAAPSGSTLPSGSSASLFVSFYNKNDSSDTLLSASAPGTATSVSVSGGTVSLPANSSPVNLTGPEPDVVLENLTQPLAGGSVIPVTFQFQHAGSVTLQLPVEAQSFYWSTYSAPAPTPTGAAVSPTATATPVTGASSTATPGGTASASSTATPGGTATASPTATP